MTVQAPVQGVTEAQVTKTEGNVTNDTTQVTNPAETVTKPPEKDQFAEKLELLSKKERALWRQRQQVEQMRKEIEAKEAEIKKFQELKSKAKQNPLDYLTEGGLTYDQITEYMLNGGKPTQQDELQMLREEFKRMRDEQAQEKEQIKKQQTQAQIQAQQQVIDNFKSEITEFVETNKAAYELSAQRDATDDIFNTISDAFKLNINEWNRSGRQGPQPTPMSIKEAADIVEEFYESEIKRLTETNKWKTKFGQPQTQEPGQKAKEPSKTLTNNMASTAASVVPAKTDNDRMKRALAKLEGNG